MRLTRDILHELGFRGEGKGYTGSPLYRFEVPKGNGYHFQIQMELNDYGEGNPNNGILSLYSPPVKDVHMVTEEYGDDKIDFLLWETNDRGDGQSYKGGIKYIDISEFNQPIAWGVTTLERLNQIYVGLTQNKPLKLKDRYPTL